MSTPNLSIPAEHLAELTQILRRNLPERGCTAYAFGSRTNGDHTPGSDIDIAIDCDNDITGALSRARAELEESSIPYDVDLVDLANTDEVFREKARNSGVILWRS